MPLRRLPALDGIRAVAALSIVVLHSWSAVWPGGWVGVDLFFVLSGFLITSILSAEYQRTGHLQLGRFYLRRALRLLPALALTILFALFMASEFRPSYLVETQHQALAAAAYVANWYMGASQGNLNGLLLHTWSLSIEEQFYLLWPLLLWGLLALGGRRLALIAALGGCFLILVHRQGIYDNSVYFRTDTRADALLIGCAIALAADEGMFRRVRLAVVGVSAAAGVAVLVGTSLLLHSLATANFDYTIIDLAAGAVVVAVGVRPLRILTGPLGSRPLVWIGRRSYGVYLFHYPIVTAMGMPEGPVKLLIVLPLTLLVAAMSYRYLEQPLLRLKDRGVATIEVQRHLRVEQPASL